MTKREFKSLGLTIPLWVPESVEEFNESAKRTDGSNACLEEATNNVVYRGSLAQFRDNFLFGSQDPEIPGVDDETGIERKTEQVVKDGKPVEKDGEPVLKPTETEAEYWNRVVATLIDNGTHKDRAAVIAAFQPLATRHAEAIVFDASAREVKPRAPSAGKRLTALAKKYVAEGRDKVERLLAYCSKNTGKDFTVAETDEENVKTLSAALKANEEWKAKQAENEMDNV